MLTREDAIRMARDAGIDQVIQHAGGVLVIPDAVLERFAAAAYAAGAAAEHNALRAELADARQAARHEADLAQQALDDRRAAVAERDSWQELAADREDDAAQVIAERDALSDQNRRLQADLDGLHKSISEIAEEIEAAIPTKPGQLLANLVREGVTALQSHIVYAAESLRA